MYRRGSGRDQFIEQQWKSRKDLAQLKQKLTPMQYEVTQNNGTEPAFHNEYWDHTQVGMYVDVVPGEPLFSSLDKLIRAVDCSALPNRWAESRLTEKLDQSHGMIRTEVRSQEGDSHLGHVFDDGPQDKGG